MSRPFVFDTWAWVEVLRGSQVGVQITGRYLDDPDQEVWTVDICLVELAASLDRDGIPAYGQRAAVERVMAASSQVLHPDSLDAASAPAARALLRRRKRGASLADGLILAMARNRGATVLTCDEAFVGEPDVVCPRATGA